MGNMRRVNERFKKRCGRELFFFRSGEAPTSATDLGCRKALRSVLSIVTFGSSIDLMSASGTAPKDGSSAAAVGWAMLPPLLLVHALRNEDAPSDIFWGARGGR